MDHSQFDEIIRDLTRGRRSRRAALQLFAAVALGLLGVQPLEDAGARKCKKIKSKKRRKKCLRKARANDGLGSSPPDDQPGQEEVAVLLAAGDIADCDSNGDEATAALLDAHAGTVAVLGDSVYDSGKPEEFAQCYEPSWGRHKSRTRPAVGNHEYQTSGASGYFGYFGSAAGDPKKGYYSYDLGGWHIVVLNSNCSKVGGCEAGSPQEQWLRADLAASTKPCTLAYWHHPRYSFGNYSDDDRTEALWQALQDHGAEVVLTGHDHNYQRYAPQDANGNRDSKGIRQFVVGTGGKSNTRITKSPPPNVEAYNGETDGILKLTLRPTGYDWEFIPAAGQSYTDSGSGTCQ